MGKNDLAFVSPPGGGAARPKSIFFTPKSSLSLYENSNVFSRSSIHPQRRASYFGQEEDVRAKSVEKGLSKVKTQTQPFVAHIQAAYAET